MKQFIVNKKFFIKAQTNEIILNSKTGAKHYRVEPRIMNLLLLLASKQGEVLSREFLIERIWENSFVGEEGLTQAVSRLRKIFNDDARNPEIIQTIQKRGYRFVAGIEVSEEKNPTAENPILDKSRKSVRKYTIYTAGSLIIAFAAYMVVNKYLPNEYDISNELFLNAKPVTSERGLEIYPSFSPDGTMLAFSMRKEGAKHFDIYLKSFSTGELKQFTDDPSDDMRPSFSPDGKFIAYIKLFKGKSEIFLKPVAAGNSIKIIECGNEAYPTFSWMADNKTIIYSDKKFNEQTYSLFIKNIETGKTEKLTFPPAGYGGDSSPIFSQDDGYVFFRRMLNPVVGDIYSIGLEDKLERKVTTKSKNIIAIGLVNKGKNIVYSGGQENYKSLFLLSVNDGSEKIIGGEDITDFSISKDGGKIIYSRLEENVDVWLKNVDGKTLAQKVLKSTKTEWFPQISPDNRQIVFISSSTGSNEIWLSNISGDSLVQLTFNTNGIANNPVWFPDGNLIAFTIFRNNRNQIYTISSNGGIPNILFEDQYNNRNPVLAKDGRSIYYRSSRDGSDEIWNYNFENKSFKRITYDKGIYGQEGPEGYFYYTRSDTPFIWRKPLSGRKSTMYFNRLYREDFNNWEIINDGIYFIDRLASSPTISLYNMKLQKEYILYTYEDQTKSHRMRLDISGDEKLLCFTMLERYEVDLIESYLQDDSNEN